MSISVQVFISETNIEKIFDLSIKEEVEEFNNYIAEHVYDGMSVTIKKL